MSFSNYDKLPNDVNWEILDVETTLIDTKKSIAWQNISLVLGGYLLPNGYLNMYTKIHNNALYKTTPIWLVGHNIAFDIIVLIQNKFINLTKAVTSGQVALWDTAIAHYMLAGQAISYPTLEQSASAFGVVHPQKVGTISQQIKAGVCPSQIFSGAPDELEEYLKQDLYLTKQVFKAQLQLMHSRSKAFQNLVLNAMEWRHNTMLMSLIGMKVDSNLLHSESLINNKKIQLLTDDLNSIMNSGLPPELKLKVTSNQDLGIYLYGGTKHYTVNEPTGELYKTGPKAGQPKFKKVNHGNYIEGHFPCTGSDDMKVDEDTIKTLKTKTISVTFRAFLEGLLELRKLSKYNETYVEPLYKQANTGQADNRIRADYQHTRTTTGRLSCARPNLQNISN